jgi:hypothetical protein
MQLLLPCFHVGGVLLFVNLSRMRLKPGLLTISYTLSCHNLISDQNRMAICKDMNTLEVSQFPLNAISCGVNTSSCSKANFFLPFSQPETPKLLQGMNVHCVHSYSCIVSSTAASSFPSPHNPSSLNSAAHSVTISFWSPTTGPS